MPADRIQRRRTKSLCEKSTEVAMNITKLSSLYLSRVMLVSRGTAKSVRARVNAPAVAVSAQDPSTLKLVQAEKTVAPSYAIEPDEGEDEIDKRAAEFISRFKAKNMQSDPGIDKEVPKCIPPHPRVKWTDKYIH